MAVLSKYILRPIISLFIKKSEGWENITGQCIIASNHASYADGPILFYETTWHCNKNIRFIAYEKLFNRWWKKIVFGKIFKQIKVNGSIEKAIEAIHQGDTIGVFPEGGRTRNGRIQKARGTGVGVLALKTKLPVVPIRIRGTWNLWNYQRKLPKLKRIVEVRVGKPIVFKDKFTKKNAEKTTKKIMEVIKKI